MLAVRSTHLILTGLYAILFFCYRTLPDVSDFCEPIATEASCNAWPNLTVAKCAAMGGLHDVGAAGSNPAFKLPLGHALPPTYRCGWVEGLLTKEEQLLLPPAAEMARFGTHPVNARCQKHECLLFPNAVSISLEFGTLFLIAAYFATYALSDSRWAMQADVMRAEKLARAASASGETPLGADGVEDPVNATVVCSGPNLGRGSCMGSEDRAKLIAAPLAVPSVL